jgi:hypothetical protein
MTPVRNTGLDVSILEGSCWAGKAASRRKQGTVPPSVPANNATVDKAFEATKHYLAAAGMRRCSIESYSGQSN